LKRTDLIATLAFFGLLACVNPTPAQEPANRTATPAARIGDETITLEELNQALQKELNQIDLQRHELLESKLDQMISQRLLNGEAKRRGLSVEQLLEEEVNRKAPKVSEEEVTDFIAKNRSRLSAGDEGELRLKVWDYLRGQKVNRQRSDYVRTLWSKAGVQVLLPEPSVARVQVDSHKGFVLGPKDAPVAIVEFSDFQCPFCKAVIATLKQVMAEYKGKVKLVFRDFPLADTHPLAPKAHEAARCAAEQGKFWEYHDLLFERAPNHSTAELKQYAGELKLDGQSFAKCLDSGKYQPAVAGDVEEGARLGASGTPTFFINGRILVGAKPLTAFQKLIDSELAKKSSQ
jgi:protein-disulfide isomerase